MTQDSQASRKRATRDGAPEEATSARVLRAAAALFRRKGYVGATTGELAASLGIQKASLYHHIHKKEDLLYALCLDSLARIQRETEQALAAEDTAIGRLRALFGAHLRAALSDQDKHATMLFEYRQLSPERQVEVVRLRDQYEELVRNVIEDGQHEGAIRQDLPAKYLTLALLNLLNWSIFWFRPGGGLTADQLADVLATVFLTGTIAPDVALAGQLPAIDGGVLPLQPSSRNNEHLPVDASHGGTG